MRRAAVHVVVLLLRGLSEKVTEVGQPLVGEPLLCGGCRAHSQAASRASPKGLRCPVWPSPTEGFPQQTLGKGALGGCPLSCWAVPWAVLHHAGGSASSWELWELFIADLTWKCPVFPPLWPPSAVPSNKRVGTQLPCRKQPVPHGNPRSRDPGMPCCPCAEGSPQCAAGMWGNSHGGRGCGRRWRCPAAPGEGAAPLLPGLEAWWC